MTRDTLRGAPLVPSEPFAEWLAGTGRTHTEVGRLLGVDESAVRRWTQRPRVSELTVEAVGIAVAGEPRLPAILYPELDWS